MLNRSNVDEYFQNTHSNIHHMVEHIILYLLRPLLVHAPRIWNPNLKTLITIKFTFLIFLNFLCFWFDHGIALSIIRIFSFIIYLWLVIQWEIISDRNNLSPGPVFSRGKLFRDTGNGSKNTRLISKWLRTHDLVQGFSHDFKWGPT